MTIPFPYQSAGVRYLSSRSGALLGDAVGLGKTYEAIWAVHECPDIRGILVIAPLVVKAQWVEVIQELSDADRVEVSELLPKTPIVEEYHAQEEDPFRVWVISHFEQFTDNSSARGVLTREWDLVLVDEVHKMSGRTAQRTENILDLTSHYRWGLSGTMVRDKPPDMWQLLNWVAPNDFSSYWAFVRRYTHSRPGAWGGMDVRGTKNLDELERKTAPYLLIRTRDDVGQELPPLTLSPVTLTATNGQLKLYKQIAKEVLIALQENMTVGADGVIDFTADMPEQLVISNAIARFTRLHQCASAPRKFIRDMEGAKEEWLRNYVEGDGEPAVIMTRYNDSAAAIRRLLKELKVEDKYMVGTWDKLSHGLNLQHYCTLIAWDTTWKRLDWEQGIGRIERTGQTRPMTVYQLLLEDSIDVDVKEMIDQKQEAVDMVMKWLRRSFTE